MVEVERVKGQAPKRQVVVYTLFLSLLLATMALIMALFLPAVQIRSFGLPSGLLPG